MIEQFNEKSKEYLEDLHPKLQKTLLNCLEICELDFEIREGNMSKKRQDYLWYKGEINRVGGPDTNGAAVHLIIYIDNIPCFNPSIYCELATSMTYAAQNNDMNLGWGGAYKGLRGTLVNLTEELETGTLQEIVDHCHIYAAEESYNYSPRLGYFEVLPND